MTELKCFPRAMKREKAAAIRARTVCNPPNTPCVTVIQTRPKPKPGRYLHKMIVPTEQREKNEEDELKMDNNNNNNKI